jgi:uracil-DNA glycosylase family 4
VADDRRPTRDRLVRLAHTIERCERCPELRTYCRQVAETKRRAYAACDYWGRPVPGFGEPIASILIVGLAPAAHGANRTGRMFTGDRSGDFLYAALHRAGLASQAHATSRDDGMILHGVYIAAALRCAPPGNRPTPPQLANCADYLLQEFRLLEPAVIIGLGAIAWRAILKMMEGSGHMLPRPRPRFEHGGACVVGGVHLLGCYHVSQQNTFTGRLTEAMLDSVLARARLLSGV